MVIHVVQPGEDLNTISALYDIPVERIIQENGIVNPDNLAIGQAIVIVQPEVVYTVQPGDSLESIAENHGISVMELLRNNPCLSDREYIYPGETLIIRYQSNKLGAISTSGYILPHIDRGVLRKSLPFLTYLSIYNYRFTSEAEIVVSDDDTDLIQLAKDYGVATMMFVTSFSERGISSADVSFRILYNAELRDRMASNILNVLKTKGFYGVNLYLESINLDNADYIADYLNEIADIFHREGYRLAVTVTPVIHIEDQAVTIETIDYSRLAEAADAIVFATYEWGRAYVYPSAITPVNITREILSYVVRLVPPEKIYTGLITIGYDWRLPYTPTAFGANSITMNNAILVAADNGVPIQFDEFAQAPYFYYVDADHALRIVWFKDARSFEAIAGLVPEFGLRGLSIWTVMEFNAQMFLVINTNYDIEKVL